MESEGRDLESHFDISVKKYSIISSTILNEIIESIVSTMKQNFSTLYDGTT